MDFSFRDRVYFLGVLQGVLCSSVEDEQALPRGAWVHFWQGIRDPGAEWSWTLPSSTAEDAEMLWGSWPRETPFGLPKFVCS